MAYSEYHLIRGKGNHNPAFQYYIIVYRYFVIIALKLVLQPPYLIQLSPTSSFDLDCPKLYSIVCLENEETREIKSNFLSVFQGSIEHGR